MDLIKFFTRNEPIAGLDISDNALRLVLLDRKQDKQKSVYIKEIAEEPLTEGVVQAGVLKDNAKFIISLKKLLSKSRTKINYVILSLPQTLSYSKIFYFPKLIAGDKLEEAMHTETQFNLPVEINNIYLDWEKTGSERNELFLETIPKEIANNYTNAFNSLRVQVVALETNLLSLIRAIDIDHSKPTAITMPQTNGTLIAIVKNQSIRFSRLVPQNTSAEGLSEEITRISNFYEVEDEPIARTMKISSGTIVKKFADHVQIKDNQNAWLSTFGAALRGLLPRKNDNLISLLPLGTEETYEHQNSVIFTKFATSIIISLSIFFILSFAVGLALVNYLESGLGQRIIHKIDEPILGNADIKKQVADFNALVSQLADAVRKMPNWSKPLEELRSTANSGIIITSFQTPAVNGRFAIQGIGKSRNDINLFKKNLDESAIYSDVALNINTADIIKKENITFGITMRLKNQSQLYAQ